MKTILVVANETLAGAKLLEVVKEKEPSAVAQPAGGGAPPPPPE